MPPSGRVGDGDGGGGGGGLADNRSYTASWSKERTRVVLPLARTPLTPTQPRTSPVNASASSSRYQRDGHAYVSK